MKVTIIPIVIGAYTTINKGLLKGLEDLEVGGRVETIQTTSLLRTARILRRVLETCCHSNFSEKPSANADVKNSKRVNNNNNSNNNNNNNSKLAQKEYKTRHDWVSKVINWEMCKKFKFDHTNKWYIHNPSSVQ